MPKPKPDKHADRFVRMFQYGTVARDAVLLVLDSSMSDADKLTYLRDWLTDSEPTQQSSGHHTHRQTTGVAYDARDAS